MCTFVRNTNIMDIKDKIAIVTGSSKGIGLETVKILLENGAKVAGWSRSETEINHPNFVNISADVQNFESVQKAYDKTTTHFKIEKTSPN